MSLVFIFPWLIEQDSDRHFREFETIEKRLTIWHIPISYSDDIPLIPLTILHTIIGRTELEHFYIGKTWMSQSFSEDFCHMIHIIRKSTSYKCRITTRENTERLDWWRIDAFWCRIHLCPRKGHRTCLTCRQTKCRIDVMNKENISIMPNCMNEMIDSFTQSRSITCVGNDGHLWVSNFYTSCQWQDTTMETVNSSQSEFIRFISRTTDIISHYRFRWLFSFERESLEESLLYSIVSTVIAPGHHLSSFFERNIYICIFFESVKHMKDNSKNKPKI